MLWQICGDLPSLVWLRNEGEREGKTSSLYCQIRGCNRSGCLIYYCCNVQQQEEWVIVVYLITRRILWQMTPCFFRMISIRMKMLSVVVLTIAYDVNLISATVAVQVRIHRSSSSLFFQALSFPPSIFPNHICQSQ